MKPDMFLKSDAKMIALLACDLADRALRWKSRALTAERKLGKLAKARALTKVEDTE